MGEYISSRSESYSESYSAKVIYTDDKMVAWSSASGAMEVFPAGSYQYPFTFKLPHDLPPSFEGSYGYVRYMVKIELDRPWYRINKRDNKVFTVVPVFDLNTISQAILPAKELKVKKLGIILFRHGEVKVECEVAKGGFVPGEMIVVSMRVINDSSKDIVKAQVKLIEVSNYVAYSMSKTVEPSLTFIEKASGDNRQRQRRKLATGEQEIHIAKHSKGNVELYLQVPSTVPFFDYCPIIKVEYVVEVKFESTGSLNSDIDVSIPIVIGTIPVRGCPPRNDSSLPSTSGPSASEMDSPPPYSGGDGGCPWFNPVTQLSMAGNLAISAQPPSYKESVNGVDGTTVDKDSIEVSVDSCKFLVL
ncbi:arrestin domain protein [Ancylostoma duodenale]|uniref:Arrestin domain protein n=1 Tax=Ancylostoma duodenale TaxID=51022 RepID=A0A0C2GPA2_9BILA|nr:arrestin domain protein [Ancylostoma duodenale]